MLREASDRHGLLVVSEVIGPHPGPLVAQYADILQVGARNMQSFTLLRELGKFAQAGAAQARYFGYH